MRAASAVLLAGILAVSGSTPHAVFRYEFRASFRRDIASCRMCYADDCVDISESRCQYYEEVDDIMDKPEKEGVVTVVDDMVYELMAPVNSPWMDLYECMPLISLHTDCNKENICEGCKTCSCDVRGKWNCREVQKCTVDSSTGIAHHKLVMVIEKLSENDQVRAKRSVEKATDKPGEKKISLLDIAEWMYGVRPNNATADPDYGDDNYEKIAGTVNNDTETASIQSKLLTEPTEEYLDFEEVLKNIASNDINYKRRKSKLKDNNIPYDYMDIDDEKIAENNASNEFRNVLNDIAEEKYITESVKESTFVVNLLPKNNNIDDNTTENMDFNNIIFKEERFDMSFPSYDRNTEIEIMKRDVSSQTDLNKTTQATSANTHTTQEFETTTSSTSMENDLNTSVLLPLTNIINEKEAEIKELLAIRDNLLHFMNIYNNISNTKYSELLNGSNTYFSIYKLDLYPEIHENLRRTNANLLEKLLYKLKRDIYEVLRDIGRIQKLSKTQGLPDDLKMLIRSMKFYIHKQGNVHGFKQRDIKLKKDNTEKLRRVGMDLTISGISSDMIKSQLIDILEFLSNKNPSTDSLLDISPTVKKIVRRVVNQNYVDDFSAVGLKVYNTEYNFTKDIAKIGKYWPICTADLANAKPHDKMYAMKLFHFVLARDITRIKDAISLIQFAHSRRMIPIETLATGEIMEKINDRLNSIKNKVLRLIKYRVARPRYNVNKENIPKEKIIKESFLKKLKNLLRRSKSEIINMVKKKIPKHDIVKTIAKHKMNALTQDKVSDSDRQTMLRWQDNLNIASRKKRHLELKNNKKHYRAIIPQYLRGKINPALFKKIKTQRRSGSKKKKDKKPKTHKTSTVAAVLAAGKKKKKL